MKETNNLDEVIVIGVNEESTLKYDDRKEFYEWVLVLKPKDVRGKGIFRKRTEEF